jgi:hypothetical protein
MEDRSEIEGTESWDEMAFFFFKNKKRESNGSKQQGYDGVRG